ncbi:MAG: antitoxin VbhA family protein [Helicobacteraceae bacterium]|jgi:hypothetical protein|nr:antitoxin VbhA family protein [Helicobacteraceae bacterium]
MAKLPTNKDGVSHERQYLANQALANAMIEGFKPDDEFLAMWEKLVKKEISYDEAIAFSIKKAKLNRVNE